MDNEYLKLVQTINNSTIKKQKHEKLIKYLKDNLLSIVAIIISIIALFK